jgi:hypothetical protein
LWKIIVPRLPNGNDSTAEKVSSILQKDTSLYHGTAKVDVHAIDIGKLATDWLVGILPPWQ